MPDIYPPREKLIELLVDDDINGFYDREDQADYFSYLMRVGFVGYNNQTDQQLIDECIDRELNLEECEDA
jgi:hypothetical protein